MDDMEIINLHKKCNKKARKVSQPKEASPKSDEPKKVSGSPKSDEPKKVSGFIDYPSEEGQKSEEASSDGKKTATKAGKNVKKIPQPKKAPKSLEFIDSSEEEEEEGSTEDDKGKKYLLCWE